MVAENPAPENHRDAAPPWLIEFDRSAPQTNAIMDCIRQRGFVILRNLFPADDLDAMFAARAEWFVVPAAGGAPGYCKFDYEKKVVQTSLLGPGAIRVMLNNDLLDLIEGYTGAAVVISESFTKLDKGVGYVYFPPHTDYAPDYRPSSHADMAGLTTEDMAAPLGLSHILYHEDTTAGAFCYAEGSHTLGAPRGGMLDSYPEDEQAEIRKTWRRLDGKAGDIALFDPRGFHGQDQPSFVDRNVSVTRYWRTDVFGYHQARPLMVYTKDLAGQNQRQLDVLGLGADSLTPLPFDHHHGFKRHRTAYRLTTKLIEHAYDLDYLDKALRYRLRPYYQSLKRLLGRA